MRESLWVPEYSYTNPFILMQIINESELLIERASRGYIKGWYSDKDPTSDQPRLDVVMDVVRNEPTVKAAIRAIADEMLKNGYLIYSDNKRLKETVEKELKNKYRFKRFLRQLVMNLLIYQNAFIEIVYKDNRPQELHLLETTEMQILSDKHGEVIGYKQYNVRNGSADFSPEECVHISLDNITTNLWGEVDLKTLYKTIALKQFLETFLTNLFRLDKFRDAWRIKEADDPMVKDFINNLKLAREQVDKELVFRGDIDKIPGKDIKDLAELIEILNYTRQQILTLLRVPPIIAGIPDNSNRSNSEVQARKAFDGRVMSLQDEISEELTRELFPLLGWEGAEFYFAPIDKRAEKDDIEIIVALKNIGLDNDSLLQYIRDVGIELPKNAKIIEKESFKNPYPESRKPADPSDEMDVETGSDSSTREEQLHGKSEDFDNDEEDIDDIEDYGIDQYEEEVVKKLKC